jgi:putative addiction module component (TIGR02574 family)
VEAARDAVLRLSAEERLALIERLWESVLDERGDDLPVTPEIEAEVDRRLAAHRRAPNELLSWSEIQRQVREGE